MSVNARKEDAFNVAKRKRPRGERRPETASSNAASPLPRSLQCNLWSGHSVIVHVQPIKKKKKNAICAVFFLFFCLPLLAAGTLKA